MTQSSVALVEDLQSAGVHSRLSPEGYSADFQVCLPYDGAFVWHVGRDTVVADANQVLFVTGCEAFRIGQRSATPYAEMIVTPRRSVVDELTRGFGANPAAHPWFRRRCRRADPWVQHQAARLRHLAACGCADSLAADEAILQILSHALRLSDECEAPTPAARRMVGAAKEYLQANLRSTVRVAHVARAVGVSPTYLTDVFRRIEGVPLHRYLMQLRVSLALVEVPHASDLTRLAIDLGFSSHSHFTAVFRQAFGETPSAFRETARRPGERRSTPP